ncbi:hypothetical protein EDC04DRAFT_2038439 [Pisolithus marmoratus]|nr:hypothetical protein EDC04DRAFT_2038439 [Pisolithus marmoratus]
MGVATFDMREPQRVMPLTRVTVIPPSNLAGVLTRYLQALVVVESSDFTLPPSAPNSSLVGRLNGKQDVICPLPILPSSHHIPGVCNSRFRWALLLAKMEHHLSLVATGIHSIILPTMSLEPQFNPFLTAHKRTVARIPTNILASGDLAPSPLSRSRLRNCIRRTTSPPTTPWQLEQILMEMEVPAEFRTSFATQLIEF